MLVSVSIPLPVSPGPVVLVLGIIAMFSRGWAGGLGDCCREVGSELLLTDSVRSDVWLCAVLPWVRSLRRRNPSHCHSSSFACWASGVQLWDSGGFECVSESYECD